MFARRSHSAIVSRVARPHSEESAANLLTRFVVVFQDLAQEFLEREAESTRIVVWRGPLPSRSALTTTGRHVGRIGHVGETGLPCRSLGKIDACAETHGRAGHSRTAAHKRLSSLAQCSEEGRSPAFSCNELWIS